MKQIITIFLLTLAVTAALNAQTTVLYDIEADAKKDIQQAVTRAKAENKHVFLQIGGNWCSWCIRFHKFTEDNREINSFLNDNFVTVKVNYSKENKNEAVMEQLEFPQRFGFPVFVILDGNGKRMHTQNSAYLEEEGSYSAKEVLNFLKQWTPAALDPASYNK